MPAAVPRWPVGPAAARSRRCGCRLQRGPSRRKGRSLVRLSIARTADDVWVQLEPETTSEIAAVERSVAQGDWTIGRGEEAITELRVLARRLGYPVQVTVDTPAVPAPRFVVVQRGSPGLAERLRELSPPNVPVFFDRRMSDRRTGDRPAPADRRQQDRRRRPPETWGTLHFLIERAWADEIIQ